jgi:hypothetical protein
LSPCNAKRTKIKRWKLIGPNQGIQIDRGIPFETTPKDEFQSLNSSRQVIVQSLCISLTCGNLLQLRLRSAAFCAVAFWR